MPLEAVDVESPLTVSALEAATQAFARDGLHGTSMDTVAADAGLGKPSLYRRFGSKDALFELVVERECERLGDHLLAAYARALDLPVEERLAVSFGALFDYARHRPHGFRLLFCTSHHQSSTVAGTVDAVRHRITDHVAGMVAREFAVNGNDAPVAADVLATVLVGMGEYTARRLVDEPDWEPDAVVRVLARMAAAGGRAVDRTMMRALSDPTPDQPKGRPA